MSRPHSARMYDYYLGGKDWFAADREAAEAVLGRLPKVRTGARANRAFMHRAVRALVREHGVRQFLDIGTGIPTAPNLHQVAQEIAPESRVVYVDNDPLVVEYADALMRGTSEGRTTYLEADVRSHDIVADSHVVDTLDLEQPVALSLVALMHFISEEDEPHGMVRRLLEPLAPGSFLVLSHATGQFDPEGAAYFKDIYAAGNVSFAPRDQEQVTRFFDGLDLLEPGLVATHRWRPDGPVAESDSDIGGFAGVAQVRQ